MANLYTVPADLRAGRCSNTEVRLLRFWEAENINKWGQLISVEMLMIDEHISMDLYGGEFPKLIMLLRPSNRYLNHCSLINFKREQVSVHKPFTYLHKFITAE